MPLDLSNAARATSAEWELKVAERKLERIRDHAKRSLNPQNSSALVNPGSYGGAGGFAAAKINRLTLDFVAGVRSADQDLFGDNIRLRGRARKLALDNPFAKKFLQSVKQNVIGKGGIMVRPNITSTKDKETAQTKAINDRIEQAWERWCSRGRCSADGKFDFVDLQALAIVNIAREGENFTKKVYGRQFNASGFALQTLDNDQVDDTYMAALDADRQVRMGVEVDKYRRPLAYHVWTGHPTDILTGERQRQRVPASEILHTAVFERPGQTRGYTWMSASILAMNQYARYEEAAVVAARASAAKFMVITQKLADGFDLDEDEAGDDRNSDGTQYMSGDAGEAMVLDPGQEADYIDPRFPTTSHKEFTQTMLRNVASGLCMQYPSLANDLEGVNFSSIRAGLVEERDMWVIIQRWFANHYVIPVYLEWLRFALLTELSDITLTADQMEQVIWMARGWEWVDPLKDADATILQLGEGLSTLEAECAKRGLRWTEVVDQRAKELAYIKAKGIELGVDITGDQGGKGVAADAEAAAAEVNGGKEGQKGGKGSQNGK